MPTCSNCERKARESVTSSVRSTGSSLKAQDYKDMGGKEGTVCDIDGIERCLGFTNGGKTARWYRDLSGNERILKKSNCDFKHTLGVNCENDSSSIQKGVRQKKVPALSAREYYDQFGPRDKPVGHVCNIRDEDRCLQVDGSGDPKWFVKSDRHKDRFPDCQWDTVRGVNCKGTVDTKHDENKHTTDDDVLESAEVCIKVNGKTRCGHIDLQPSSSSNGSPCDGLSYKDLRELVKHTRRDTKEIKVNQKKEALLTWCNENKDRIQRQSK